MNWKVFLFTFLIVALIESESEAKRKRGRKRGNFGGGGAKRQVERWCNNFEDDASAYASCVYVVSVDIENHMEQMKNDTETYLKQQKEELEDVVKTACKRLGEDEGAMTCNRRINANICSKLLEEEGQ